MDKIFINIDSNQRNINVFPTPSLFNLDTMLPNLLPIKNSNYISLISANIPISKNKFIDNNTYNNFIYIKSETSNIPGGFSPNGLNSDKFIIIYIPNNDYNYDINNIITAINNSLVTERISMIDSSGNSKGLYFSLINNIISISNNLSNVTYTINFANQQNIHNNYYITLGYILGFRKLEYKIIYNININADCHFNLNPQQYIFVRINDYGYYYSNLHNPIKVLSKLDFDSITNRYIYKNGSNESWESYKFKQPTDIKKIEIELIDYTGNPYKTMEDYNITIEIGTSFNEILYKDDIKIMEITDKPINNDIKVDYLLNDTNELINNNDNIKKKEKKDKKNKKNYGFNY